VRPELDSSEDLGGDVAADGPDDPPGDGVAREDLDADEHDVEEHDAADESDADGVADESDADGVGDVETEGDGDLAGDGAIDGAIDLPDGSDAAGDAEDDTGPELCTPPDGAPPFVELLPMAPNLGTANVRRIGGGAEGVRLLVSEPRRGQVQDVRCADGSCTATALPTTVPEGERSPLGAPVRAIEVDLDGDTRDDLLVADIGILPPSIEPVGRVLLASRGEADELDVRVLLEGVGRVTCAEPVDLDGDEDLDVLVCEFGHETGSLRWLEQTDEGFVSHELDGRPGTIHAWAFDADGDEDLDVAAVISQDHEVVMLYRQGEEGFVAETLFAAAETFFGMSGLEVADLDGDEDWDLVFSNGDTLDGDLPVGVDPWALHGVAWLENDGEGDFTHREIGRFSGAYAAPAVDFDGDGDLDLVVSAHQPTWVAAEAPRMSLAWFENDGEEAFARHDLACAPDGVMSIALADYDGDGDLDVFGGSIAPVTAEARFGVWVTPSEPEAR
jgi:hypothetical protein